MTKKRPTLRKPRLLRARPLLVGVGATLLLVAAPGCGDDESTGMPAVDMGIPPIHDMAKPVDLKLPND